MKITPNATFGQLYVQHAGDEYRVPRQQAQAFLKACGLDKYAINPEWNYAVMDADAILSQYAELISGERLAAEICDMFND